MKVKLTVFLLFFSSLAFSSRQIMDTFFFILSTAVICENNSFAVCPENKKNKPLVLEVKNKNKLLDKSFKKDNFKKIKNNIQQPNKRNF